jgi:hypothetical protein
MTEYADPVRQAVERYLTENSSVVSAVAAKEIIDTVLPESLIQEWLWARRYETLTAYITHICRMTGARNARDEPKGVFADRAEELENAIAEAEATGTHEPIHEITKMWHCANQDGKPVRKRLGDMNKTELRFVRNRAESNVRYYQRRIRFLALLEEHLGDGQTVSDVFSADELETILETIT